LLGGAQTRVEDRREINHNIRCTIQVPDREWTPAAPAIVRGKVENLTDGSLEIHVQPILHLSSKTSRAERDKYWAPVDLLQGGPLPLNKQPVDQKGDVVAIKMIPIKLALTARASQLISELMPDTFFGIEKSVQFGLHENCFPSSSRVATICGWF
jgi:hypothetical protein